jgi:hypothetical protein
MDPVDLARFQNRSRSAIEYAGCLDGAVAKRIVSVT